MKKNFRAMQCQKCGKETRMTEDLQQKNFNLFWFPVKNINIYNIYFQIQTLKQTSIFL